MQPKITDYKIVWASTYTNEQEFNDVLKANIQVGWQPFGAPFTNGRNIAKRWNQLGQAMVKYENVNIDVNEQVPRNTQERDSTLS